MSIEKCTLGTALVILTAIETTLASLACVTNPCIYGICMEIRNGSSYSCYCIDGYTGTNCQTNWDECWSSPCLNGGTCHDGIAYYNCTCPEGFVGVRCEENVDECGSNPCLNNGTCFDIANGYRCQCQPGYSGLNCEMDMAVCNTTEETRCSNGGACIEGPGITFTCRCLPGWTGKLCDLAVDECSSSPCENGGVCIDMHATYVCACPYGYTGTNCETQVELCSINTCENNALCVIEARQSICYCVPDYHGERCQFRYDECLKGPGCLNGGNCIDGVDSYSCSCPVKLTGRFCECLVTESGKLNCNFIGPPRTLGTTIVTQTTTTSNMEETEAVSQFSTREIEEFSSTRIITEQTSDSTTRTISDCTTSSESLVTERSTELTSLTELTSELYSVERSTASEPSQPENISTDESTQHIEIIAETTEYSTSQESRTTSETEVQTEISSFPLIPTVEISEKPVTKADTVDISTLPITEDTLHLSTPTTSRELTTYESWHSPIQPYSTITDKADSWPPWTLFSTYTKSETEVMTSPSQTDDTYGTTATTEVITDCLRQRCNNQGSCVNSTEGPKCHCKFGWTGKFCDQEEGIKVAAFKGRSYLLHLFGNSSTITISLKMRTLAENGIILYAHASSNIYISLYLQQGFLKFQFSCGIQTMLFSELKYSINTGFQMDITSTLELLPENGLLKKCNGSVKLNGTLSMSGKQETLNPTVGMKMSGVLYLGGLSAQVADQVDLPYKGGITGCMHDLLVNEISRKIYGNAFDGVDVSECESLACLSNPCQNSATCVEIGQKWNCLCPSGFLGKMCQRSICLNNPCKYGGTCVIYPGSGFMCLCALGKHGMFCDQDLEIGHPQFSSSVSGLSSYTAYPLPGAIHHSFELHFRFIPSSLDQIALMIFIGQSHPHDSSSDHLAVSFIKGYVVLTWNLGSGPRRIFTPQAIIDRGHGKETHTVRLGRSGQIGWLQVDSMPNVTGTSPGWLTQLNTRPIIYVGGHESRNFSGLPHDLPLHSGYSGCLYDLELRAGKVRLSIQRSRDAVGRNVGQCMTKHCHNSTCLHTAACIDHGATFTCLCQDGWFGAGCELRYNPCDSMRNNCSEGSTCVPLPSGYECDCPLGKTGRYCHIDETLSDVGFSGHRSFLSLAPVALELSETCIDMEIKPDYSRGLIFYSSQTHALSTMFISLSLHGGVLEFRIQPIGGQRRNGEVLVVRSGRVLTLGEWTRIRAGRYGRRIYLSVEGSVNSGTLFPGEILLPTHSPLYIGGVPDLSELASGAVAGLPVSFTGCVRRLWLNWRSVTLNHQNIIQARNINDCDGSACGGDICYNGGSCWLTADNRPRCNCPQQYNGDRCENQESCAQVGCKNNGRCVIQSKKERCSCPTGWTGPFCNFEVPVGASQFGSDSFLVVDSQHVLTKRGGNHINSLFFKSETNNTPSYLITYLHLNFSTARHDAMILWTSRNEEFLGIGIETGFMKIVWRVEGRPKTEVLLPATLMADGTWHTLTVTATNNHTVLSADNSFSHSYTLNSSIRTDGIFYLGGFPGDRKVIEETFGCFQTTFSGCIKEIAWNEKFSIVDFSKFSGENVGSCDLVYP